MENNLMTCKKCKKETPAEGYYCMWCGAPVRKHPKKKMYQRPDGLYEKILTINHKRIAFRGKSEREVTRKILEYHEAEERGPLFADVAWAWREEHFKTLEYNSQTCYKKPFERILSWFENQYIKEITPADVETFIKYLALDRHYAAKTVNIDLALTHLVFTYAVVNNIIPINPSEQVRIPKGLKKTSRRAPTEEEIEIVKANVDKPFGLFYFFILYTGCRRGEALAIQFKDIDRDNKIIHITKSIYYAPNQPEIKGPKSESGIRDIPLLDILDAKLPKGKPNDFLFGGEKPLSRARMQYALKKYQEETGLAISPHFLRHGYATILYDAGIDIKIAQGLLGHSDFQITMNTYTHISSEHVKKDVQKINDFLRKYTEAKEL